MQALGHSSKAVLTTNGALSRNSIMRASVEKLPLLGLSLIGSWLAVKAQADLGAVMEMEEHALSARFANATFS
jgi:hypothetical protein